MPFSGIQALLSYILQYSSGIRSHSSTVCRTRTSTKASKPTKAELLCFCSRSRRERVSRFLWRSMTVVITDKRVKQKRKESLKSILSKENRVSSLGEQWREESSSSSSLYHCYLLFWVCLLLLLLLLCTNHFTLCNVCTEHPAFHCLS